MLMTVIVPINITPTAPARQRKRRLRCSLIGLMLLTWSPRIISDVTPDGLSNTQVTVGAGNVPVVDIAAPGATGVSHNSFATFNVETQGVVINNSLLDGASALAGAISGNANFTSLSAGIILNEVSSTSRSTLLGTTEIFGDNASYILANPNGITCSGCGFIRTPTAVGDMGGLREVLLTTTNSIGYTAGTGDLKDLTIGTANIADILIGPGGLDVSEVDITTLFTRRLIVNGLINAGSNRLQVLAGTGVLNLDAALASNRTYVATQPGDNAISVAIDASVAGAMYAGQIYIMATEAGVGVTLDNDLISNAGDIELTAEGDIIYRNANASGTLNVTANAAPPGAAPVLTVIGNTTAGSDINWNLSGDAM
ncbi:MAG: filamentous hemagglutinin N-terminal domain-containing protein, partial [Gammaproteobacteria bacterium]